MFKYVGSQLYRFGNFLHRTSYEKGILTSVRLPIPTVAIGNLTVGGTGKTPFVMHLSQKLFSNHRRVVILSRGYKGSKSEEGAIVSDGKKVFLTALEAGDEPLMMAHHLKNIPILIGRDRSRMALKAVPLFNPDIFLLDDAFQHYRINADFNILLIDAYDPFGGENLFPLGRLREPLSAIKRAHHIILSNSSFLMMHQKEILKQKIKTLGYLGSISEMDYVITSSELQNIQGKKVFVFCGLAQPQRLIRLLQRYHVDIVGYRFFRDHHFYSTGELDEINKLASLKKADIILTTEKDSVRIQKDFYFAVKIEIKFTSGEDHILSSIENLQN